ncbi:ferredoxin [Microtetraspora malaysiensis]|uniref:ferredoxin n=1 Tax=Microtetraspora malaysiensis TaxID=161358 RepID=UPI003D8D155F
MTIVVDAARCVGSGTRMAIAPDRFEFDDEDRSRPIAETVEEDTGVRTAVDMCPTQAITIRRTTADAPGAKADTR